MSTNPIKKLCGLRHLSMKLTIQSKWKDYLHLFISFEFRNKRNNFIVGNIYLWIIKRHAFKNIWRNTFIEVTSAGRLLLYFVLNYTAQSIKMKNIWTKSKSFFGSFDTQIRTTIAIDLGNIKRNIIIMQYFKSLDVNWIPL